MKILHVIDTVDPKMGGVTQAVITMSEHLSKAGVFNEVVSLDNAENLNTNSNYRLTGLGPSSSKWHYSKRLIPWLLNNFCRFDAIIVHGLWLFSSYATEKAARKYKRLVSRHVDASICPNLYIMPHGMLDPYFQVSPERRLKAIRNWIYWKLFESRVVKNAHGLLFTCQEERDLARKAFNPYSPKRELVVGLGVDEPPVFTSSMATAFYSLCPQVKEFNYLLCLGRIDQKKGIEILLTAYELLLKTHHRKALANDNSDSFDFGEGGGSLKPDMPKLVIAGPGLQSQYGAKLQLIVESSALLKSNVFFPGMLHGDAKWGAFYGSEAFTLFSHQENFGIAVVEALSCSKPVLISKQINICREISEEGAGVVNKDSVNGALKSMNAWMHHSPLEKLKMGKCARVCFEKHYSTSTAVHKLINAISSDPI